MVRTNCVPVTKSGFKRRVSWKSGSRVENISGPFRVKVTWEGDKAQDGRLYAIYIQ